MRRPPWFEEAFGRGYLEVYPHRDERSARSEVRGVVERGFAGRVLDLGCGFGRHTLALLEMGLDAFGLDYSAALLGRADERLSGRLVRGDFRDLPFRSESFDGVAMLFSSFGYFDDETNLGVVREVARVLRPGATALFDLMNAERVRATLVPESCTRRDGFELVQRRRLTGGGKRVVKDVRLERDDGARSTWHEDVRLYEPEEFAALAASAGLEVVRTEGDFDGSPLLAQSPRQIVWVRRHVPGGRAGGRGAPGAHG